MRQKGTLHTVLRPALRPEFLSFPRKGLCLSRYGRYLTRGGGYYGCIFCSQVCQQGVKRCHFQLILVGEIFWFGCECCYQLREVVNQLVITLLRSWCSLYWFSSRSQCCCWLSTAFALLPWILLFVDFTSSTVCAAASVADKPFTILKQKFTLSFFILRKIISQGINFFMRNIRSNDPTSWAV